ncbi:MAG: ABC transporter ATP-binding protein, partial [Gammaproteobacteria bacterium]|nr:ABC transporter ATP-binding protein [Gammaproteobacteria bacterium]
NGLWREYAGGYSDYLRQRPPAAAARPNAAAERAAARASGARSPPNASARTRIRLSYNEQRELAALPEEIETLEREQSQLNERMSTPDYHRLGAEQMRGDRRRLEELEALLLQKFSRWEWLEERRARST